MNRNVLLVGGPGNGKLINVSDGDTAVSYCELEQDFTFSPAGCTAITPLRSTSYLYVQDEKDKSVFHYTH